MREHEEAAADAADEHEAPEGEAHIDAGDAFDEEFSEAITDALDEDTETGGESNDDEQLAEGPDDDDEDGPSLDDFLEDEPEEKDDKGEKGEQPRDAEGKFTKADDAKPDAAAAAGDAGTDAAAKPAAGTAAETQSGEPVWEPFSVNANKEPVAIGEAKITRADGHVYLAIEEKDFPRFQARVSRGIVGEQLYRKLEEGVRELEARKTAPPPPSEAEIEAKLVLDAIKDELPNLLDEKDLEILELRIKNAKHEAQVEYHQQEEARVAQAREPQWDDQQAEGIANTMIGLVQAFPELKGLSREQLEEVYERELLPVRNALYFREGEQLFANTQYMYDRLKARVGSGTPAGSAPATDTPASGKAKDTGAAPSGAAASASNRTPAGGNTAGNSGSTAKPKGNVATSAERFNRGVDAGAKPRSTSVKNNRNGSASAQRTTRAGERDNRRSTPGTRDRQMAAEDAVRKTTRNWLNSDSLDLEDGLEEGDEE